jgi:hypothetical protein
MILTTARFPTDTIPSESTIEQMTNYCLLRELGIPSAWIYVPTRNDELTLGFDASIQNTKLIIIQYKRLKQSGKSHRINLNVSQHLTLLKKFPVNSKFPLIKPYVFYAFSRCKNYEEVDNAFQTSRIDNLNYLEFLKKCTFFDAHDINQGHVTVIPSLIDEDVKLYGMPNKKIKSYNGIDFVSKAKECSLGNNFIDFMYLVGASRGIEDIGVFANDPLKIKQIPRVSFLTMPSQ